MWLYCHGQLDGCQMNEDDTWIRDAVSETGVQCTASYSYYAVQHAVPYVVIHCNTALSCVRHYLQWLAYLGDTGLAMLPFTWTKNGPFWNKSFKKHLTSGGHSTGRKGTRPPHISPSTVPPTPRISRLHKIVNRPSLMTSAAVRSHQWNTASPHTVTSSSLSRTPHVAVSVCPGRCLTCGRL